MGVHVLVHVSIGRSALDCFRQPDACTCSQRLSTFAESMDSSTTFIAQQEISEGPGLLPTAALVKWHGLVDM
jgi:hypothetical protein